MKQRSSYSKTQPWWKKRIKQKIKQLRQDISRLERIRSNDLRNNTLTQSLKKKYNIARKGLNRVVEELKQRLTAQAAKLKRYEDRQDQYRQNRMFETNQKRLFKEMEGIERNNDFILDAEESRELWNGIWGKSVKHNDNAEWLKQLERDLNVEKQDNVKITAASVKKQVKKMASWKSPGPDGLHGYWLKNFTTVHARLVEQLNEYPQHRMVPTWMTKGRTVLIIKDKEIGPAATKFRPITCLSLMWKLLTGVMSDEIYQHLESKRLLPSEQKGRQRNSRGTKDQLLIDKMIIRNCKRRLTGLGMAWIDFRKAFDMVPHTWITKCMTMFSVADNMTNLLENSMKQWNTELISGGESLGHVEIKRGIFQGDSLSPLLFILALIPLTIVLRKVKAGYDLGKGNGIINHLLFMDDLKLYGKSEKQIDTLVQSVRIVSSDMCMEFGVSKCAILIMK